MPRSSQASRSSRRPKIRFPSDPGTAMQWVLAAHQESQAAFFRLLTPPPELAARRDLHRLYREATARLLEMLRQHNESGLAPSPWDLPPVAQPLVQQALIEADLADALGDPTEGKRLRDWAFATARTHLPPLALGRVRRSLATQYAAEGRFPEALAEFEDVRRLFVDAGDSLQAAQTSLEEAALLEWLGDHERALAAITSARRLADLEGAEPVGGWDEIMRQATREAHTIASGGGATGEADRAAANWRIAVELAEHEARVRKARAEYDVAADLFQSVLPHYESLGGGAAIEYQLAAIDFARGRPAAARERLARIEPAFADGLLSGKVAGLRLLQSCVALALGELSQALRLANAGLAELERHPDEDLGWRLHWRKAQALRALNRPDESLAVYSTATNFVDSLRKSPLGYRLDSTALGAKLPLIEEAITLAADRNAGAACLGLIERFKARALSAVLSLPIRRRPGATDLETEFDQVTQRLDALEYQGYSGAADALQVRSERAALLDRRIQLAEQIRVRDPRWRELSVPAPLDSTKLAAALQRRRQAALTLHVHESTVLSVLVVDGRFEIGRQTIDPDLQAALDEYVRSLVADDPERGSPDVAELGLDASRFIPAALLEKALAANSLVVAPHDRLHLLPWPSLPFGPHRLFERTAVGILPNLTCATALDYQPAARPQAALAGITRYPESSKLTDLPSIRVELENLSALYHDRLVAPPLIDEQATEDAVRELATHPEGTSAVLHLACHAVLSEDDPLGSGLLLIDGKLDAAEWARLRLPYAEVVLSACSTGWRPQAARGVRLHGDDILGLPGALLEAGARSILVSIPKADDEGTSVFMTGYHGRRAQGIEPLRAFRETQRELLASGRPPGTWSGLVFYGVR